MTVPDSPLPREGRAVLVAAIPATEQPTATTSSRRQKLANLFVGASGEPMSRDVFCVAPEVSLEALTDALIGRGLDAVLVIDSVGRIIGVRRP